MARGDGVHLLTLTGGEERGGHAEGAEEQRRAARLLGARLIHRDLEDIGVAEGGATISAIKAAIDELRPDVVYTHTDRDDHQDHRNAHRATLLAARGVPRVCCYQSPSTTIDFRPTRFVAIDAFVDRKVEVIGAYSSRAKVRRYLAEDVLRATVRYWSRYASRRSPSRWRSSARATMRAACRKPAASSRCSRRCTPMLADGARVLVTGAGGPPASARRRPIQPSVLRGFVRSPA